MNSNINISVTGGEEKGREIVASVLTNALVTQGFTNVAQIAPNGEPIVGTDVPSALATMREINPDFLGTKIQVVGIPTSDIEKDVPENNVATAIHIEESDGPGSTMIRIEDAA